MGILATILTAIGVLTGTAYLYDANLTDRALDDDIRIISPAGVVSLGDQCGNYNFYTPREGTDWGVLQHLSPDEDGVVTFTVASHSVPAYGWMTDEAFDIELRNEAGRIPQSMMFRGLFEGYTYVWLNYTVDMVTENSIRKQLESYPRVIVARLSELADHKNPMPSDRAFGFSQWNKTQLCDEFSTPNFQAFLIKTLQD